MKAVAKMWFRPWILLFLLLAGGISVRAQSVPGCDTDGKTPVVDFQLTYDPVANRYTAWYVPTDNTLHRAVTGQFTIITPNGFTTPGGTGRDASFQITNINGSWSDYVFDNEQITSAGQAPLPALNGLAVHQVGMAPAGVDIDPDGAGPQTIATPVTPGVAVPLFSFPGTGCASVVRILVNNEPIKNALATFGANPNNEITIQSPRAAGNPALERYCKNASLNTVTLVLPDIQDDTQTLCASSSTYSNNYFTQVLRNWTPASLPAGTLVVPTANQQWDNFTVSPASLQGNVTINPTTGAYTLTYPTVGGVIQPGSLTICNTLRDNCNTASDQACVVISWLSSGSVSITSNSPNCLSNGPTTITLSATNGFSSYSWSGPGLTSTTGNPVTANLSSSGVYAYTVIATGASGCSTTATTSFTINPKPSVTLAPLTPTVCLGGSIGLTATPSGGTPGYTYAWSGPNFSTASTVNTISIPNAALTNSGIYSVVVTDANQCSATATTPVAISVINCCSLAASMIASQSVVCAGNTVNLSVNTSGAIGTLSYQWSPNSAAGNSPTATVSPTATTTYIVVVTDAGAPNCTRTATITVTVNQPPVVQASISSSTICSGSSVNLSANVTNGTAGAYNYSWKGPNGYTSSNQNPVIAPAQAFHTGSYTVVVTDANGCSGTAVTPFSLSVINCPVPCPAPLALNLVVTAAQCSSATGSITATPTNGVAPFTYQWSNGNGQASGVNSITGLSAGVYSVTITDANGCTGVSGSINLPGSQAPQVSLASVSAAACGQSTGAILVNVSGGTTPYTYQWSPNVGSTSAVSGLSAGTYTVTVSDGSGCGSTLTVVVPGSSNLSLVTSSSPAACGQTNGTATVIVSGGTTPYLYKWITGGSTASISGLTSGAYSVTVSDAGGCSSTAVVNVNSVSGPVLTLSHVDASCHGSASGSASVVVNGGTAPYSYFWSHGFGTSSVNGLIAGVYSVTVVDGNGCRASQQVTIGEPGIIIAVYNPVKPVCPSTVGSVMQVSISGGTAPFTYAWSNGAITASLSGVAPGSYTVTITDAHGCVAIGTAVVESEDCRCKTPLALNLVVTAAQCSSATGSITATPTNGVAPFTYQWSNGNGQASGVNSITGLSAGVYSVTITDANGCTGVSGSINLPGSQAPQVSLASVSAAACGQSTGAILVNVSGGTTPYTYQWSPNVGSTSAVSGLSAGTYTVTVSDGSGCGSTLTVVVPGSSNLSLVTSSSPAACGQTNGTATVIVSGGTTPYLYNWSNGGSTASISVLSSGAYSVTVSDGGGCSSTAVVNVNSVSGPILTLSHVDASCHGSASGSASVVVNGGTAPYSYFWSHGFGTSSVNGLIAGVYSVTVVDGNGCRASQQVTIGEPGIIIAVYNPVKPVCPSTVGSVMQVSISGGTAPFSYVWSNGAITASLSGVAPGSYTVTITDAHGCIATGTADILPVSCASCLQAFVYLQGALVDADGVWPANPQTGTNGEPLMRDELRALNLIPLADPYRTAPYLASFYPGGAASIAALDPFPETIVNPGIALAARGDSSVVDWVLVEFRDPATPSVVKYTRSGLVLRNGAIVDVDGRSCLDISHVAGGNYSVAVRHRNHLGAMTQSTVSLNTGATQVTVDFRKLTPPSNLA